MALHPLAGKPAPQESLTDISTLLDAYSTRKPDISDKSQRVSFGTSGHRGSSLRSSFNEAHVLAISQAICEYRSSRGIDGPLFIGKDTHALSEPAFISALEVLVANGVSVMVDRDDGFTPTPAISHAILTYNRGRTAGLADGIVITPSHNPPEDGGFKYNPPHGGPADTDITRWIEDRANALLADNLQAVKRMAYAAARQAAHGYDYVGTYVDDLASVVDMDAIRGARLKIGVDPLGGAGVAYWQPIIDRYGIEIDIVNRTVDPAFGFMSLDWDGKIRMDCSSPYAMAKLIALKDRFDIAFGNDTDHDRHGIVTRARADEPQSFPRCIDPLSVYAPPGLADGCRHRQDRGEQQHDRSRGREDRPHAWSKCRWDSSGSSTACTTARSDSAARRAPAPRSCGATARCGPPTRTASSWTCWRRK